MLLCLQIAYNVCKLLVLTFVNLCSQFVHFCLHFSYNESAIIKITIMASIGSSKNLVALQNIIIKTETNAQVTIGQEPEVDITDKVKPKTHEKSF